MKKYANYIYWHRFTAKWWSSKSQRSKRKTQTQSPNFSMDVTSAKHLSNLYIVGSKIINKIDKIYPATAWSSSDWIITILSQSQGCPEGHVWYHVAPNLGFLDSSDHPFRDSARLCKLPKRLEQTDCHIARSHDLPPLDSTGVTPGVNTPIDTWDIKAYFPRKYFDYLNKR
jgi:hypothetical protein